MTFRTLSIVSLLAVLSGPLSAQQIDGNELLNTCTSEDPVFQGFCVGYIIGNLEGTHWGAFRVLVAVNPDADTQELNRQTGIFLFHCKPEAATNEQLRDVVVKYLRDNPQSRHESVRTLISQAYIEAFPC